MTPKWSVSFKGEQAGRSSRNHWCGQRRRCLVELLNDPDRREALLDAATGPIELVGVAVRDAAKRRKGIPSTCSRLTSPVWSQ